MGFLSRLLGTNKAEKKLIRELRLQITAGVSQLITEDIINSTNFIDWRVIWENKLGYHDDKMADKWAFQNGISPNAAIAGFHFIKRRKPNNSSELLRTLLISESYILAKEIYSDSLDLLKIKIEKVYKDTYEGKFKI